MGSRTELCVIPCVHLPWMRATVVGIFTFSLVASSSCAWRKLRTILRPALRTRESSSSVTVEPAPSTRTRFSRTVLEVDVTSLV